MPFYRCIFCLHRHPGSLEHVFLESLGGRYTIDLPCTDCNNRLGSSVDAKLSDHLLTQLTLYKNGLIKPTDPIPLLNAVGTIDEDGRRIITRSTAEGGVTMRLVPIKSESAQADGTQTIQIDVDETDEASARKSLARFNRKLGHPEPTDEEWDAIMAGANRGQYVHPKVHYAIPVGEMPGRALAKIIYELACVWLGESWFRSDPTARALRRYILTGKERSPLVLYGSFDTWPEPLREMFAHTEPAHVAILPMQNACVDQIPIYIRVMDAWHAWLVVSKVPNAYGLPADGRVLVNQPGKRPVETTLGAVTLEFINLKKSDAP